jgi:hypothetical protein
MKVVLKLVAVLFFAIAAFLVYAVIAAATSDEGARVGVCVGYAIAAVLLSFAGVKLWSLRRKPAAPSAV